VKRIQRKRTKGWRMPSYTIYVGRPTKYGNPYKRGKDGNIDRVLFLYKCHLEGALKADSTFLDELKGKDLACWCSEGVLCHADIIIKVMKERGLA
jgi:hypothetical protein